MQKITEYKKIVRYFFILFLLVVETTIFYCTWNEFYYSTLLYQYHFKGKVLFTALYFATLLLFTYNLGGSKFGLLKKNNISFSQFLATLVTNIIFYFVVVLLAARFISPIPIIVVTVVDGIFIGIWGNITYKILEATFPPRELIVLYDEYEPDDFLIKINTRNDKYIIKDKICLKENEISLNDKMSKSDGVILYDLDVAKRNKIVKKCFSKNIRVYIIPKITDVIVRGAEELNLFDTQVLLVREYTLSIEQRIMKRFMDVLISLILLIITSPIMLIIAIAVKICDGGKIFYTQKRCTKDGEIFVIHKFRSMREDRGDDIAPTEEGDSRITSVGKMIRALRIDELPQLFDILIGKMSLVGPRPERIEHVKKYTEEIPEFSMRLKVKAGLTGYAQIYGKYNTTAYDKLKLDLTYINNYSIFMDIKLMLLTMKIVFMKESTEGFKE